MVEPSSAPEATYASRLADLSEAKPLIAKHLIAGEEARLARLNGYFSGARLKGLEQLYDYLNRAEHFYANTAELAPLSFLVARVRADFETALEAALTGYVAVASDAMRDVMEIEGLLLAFLTDESLVDEWLTCDSRTRRNKFAPVKIRDRLKAAGVAPYANDSFEPVDYRAHSEALHVVPETVSFLRRGLVPRDGLFDDIPFIEMFEHGNRVMTAIELLRVGRLIEEGRESGYEPLTDRNEFDDARDRTTQMQVIVIAFVEAPKQLAVELGRTPKRSEVLQRVADRLRAQPDAT
jgi:hypothetical protein